MSPDHAEPALPVSFAAGEEALDDFLRLPRTVYGRDPLYCAAPEEKTRAGLLRPDFAGRQESFVARRGAAAVARLAARLSPSLAAPDGRAMGMIGFFESRPDPDAARALLLHGVEWLLARGAGRVIGPMDGDTWHSYRLNAGPFDAPPFLMEPYNPPYYPRMWESAGFAPLESYSSRVVADLAAAARNTEKIASRCAARGYTLRPLRRDRFPDELEILHRLSRAIFRDNFLYTDIPLPEFVRMYEGSGPLLRRDLVLFARSPAGEDIGFVFALPDEIDAVRAMRGGRGAAARLRFLLRRGRAGAVNVKTLGVLPRHRGSGVAVQLVHAIYRAALDSGFGRANLCLIRDGNASARLDGGASDLLRRYALYEYRGAPPP